MVFRPTEAKLPGAVYRTASDVAARFLDRVSTNDWAGQPEWFGRHFGELFQYVPADHERGKDRSIQEDRNALRFREVARKVNVISDDTQAVIAPRGTALRKVAAIRERARSGGSRFTRQDLRGLQRFMVDLHGRELRRLDSMGRIQPLLHGMELRILDDAAYHERLGVVIDRRPAADFLL